MPSQWRCSVVRLGSTLVLEELQSLATCMCIVAKRELATLTPGRIPH